MEFYDDLMDERYNYEYFENLFKEYIKYNGKNGLIFLYCCLEQYLHY